MTSFVLSNSSGRVHTLLLAHYRAGATQTTPKGCSVLLKPRTSVCWKLFESNSSPVAEDVYPYVTTITLHWKSVFLVNLISKNFDVHLLYYAFAVQ